MYETSPKVQNELNKLTLNSSKTEFMLIGSRQRLRTYDTSPKLIIGGDIIKQV